MIGIPLRSDRKNWKLNKLLYSGILKLSSSLISGSYFKKELKTSYWGLISQNFISHRYLGGIYLGSISMMRIYNTPWIQVWEVKFKIQIRMDGRKISFGDIQRGFAGNTWPQKEDDIWRWLKKRSGHYIPGEFSNKLRIFCRKGFIAAKMWNLLRKCLLERFGDILKI